MCFCSKDAENKGCKLYQYTHTDARACIRTHGNTTTQVIHRFALNNIRLYRFLFFPPHQHVKTFKHIQRDLYLENSYNVSFKVKKKNNKTKQKNCSKTLFTLLAFPGAEVATRRQFRRNVNVKINMCKVEGGAKKIP